MRLLASAILAVMDEVKGIEKTLNVGTGQGSYKGVSDQEVKRVIGAAMHKHGLCIIPTSIQAKTQIDRWEETTEWNGKPQTKMKQSVFVECETKYLLLHSSGESIEVAGYGHGVDSQDKSAGKSSTYALKYALLYLFLVPTGKIDDADNTHSDEAPVPPKPQPKPEYTKEIMKEVDACQTKEELAAVWKKYPELGKVNEDFKSHVTDKGNSL